LTSTIRESPFVRPAANNPSSPEGARAVAGGDHEVEAVVGVEVGQGRGDLRQVEVADREDGGDDDGAVEPDAGSVHRDHAVVDRSAGGYVLADPGRPFRLEETGQGAPADQLRRVAGHIDAVAVRHRILGKVDLVGVAAGHHDGPLHRAGNRAGFRGDDQAARALAAAALRVDLVPVGVQVGEAGVDVAGVRDVLDDVGKTAFPGGLVLPADDVRLGVGNLPPAELHLAVRALGRRGGRRLVDLAAATATQDGRRQQRGGETGGPAAVGQASGSGGRRGHVGSLGRLAGRRAPAPVLNRQ